jgi:predicted N-acetyltransferase YhbS
MCGRYLIAEGGCSSELSRRQIRRKEGILGIDIRAERITDYSDIAGLNYDAFVRWHPAAFKAEPLLVDVLRHSPLFDPELSLVAEMDGRVVGHALFSPFDAIVLGARQRGVFLAPLCVAPAHQRQGIGSLLMDRGHEVARSKGYAFALLCGHPDYYPRFGYQQRMFSLSGCRVSLAPVRDSTPVYEERPVLATDLNWITALWREQHGHDSLALYPGDTLSQWFSHAPAWRSSVLSCAGQPVVYVRYKDADPVEVKELLVKEHADGEALAWLLGALGPGGGEVLLPQGPEMAAARLGRFAVSIADARQAHDAFMLKILDEHSPTLREYCAAVATGRLPAGVMSFPASFDIGG